MSSYYPIGTVVKLTLDPDLLFMIAGYLPRQDEGEFRDYFVVPLPLGLSGENQYVLCDHSRITEVVYPGYCDEECQEVLDGFDQFADRLRALASAQSAQNT